MPMTVQEARAALWRALLSGDAEASEITAAIDDLEIACIDYGRTHPTDPPRCTCYFDGTQDIPCPIHPR